MASKSKKSEKLTPKQERFCQEYLIDSNATQAAIRAGYSEKTAMEQGYQLLQKTSVAVCIENLRAAQSQRVQVTADMVLSELLKIATMDIGRAFDKKGDLLPIQEIPEDVRRSISGIEIFAERDWVEKKDRDEFEPKEKEVVGFTKKIKFWDKVRALELLGKHLKLFTDKVQLSGKVTLADLVAGSMKDEKEKE